MSTPPTFEDPATRGPSRAAPKSEGYSVREVEDFLEQCDAELRRLETEGRSPEITAARIRSAQFGAEKGGFEPSDVDAELAEYEDRFAAAEKAAAIQRDGAEAWHDHASRLADLVMGRLHRAPGERFRRPLRRRTEGYFTGDVDRLCDELLEYFQTVESVDPGLIRSASFRAATAKHAYDEAQVDAFLERAVELIHALR